MIDGLCLKNAIISGANNILKHKNHVNELNIFPVPDGDTGTNMSMTISSAVEALKKTDDSLSVGEAISAFVPALLRGARGNSGVILSILFRGFSQLFSSAQSLTGCDVAKALEIGVKAAYGAVTKPTEGTMLTVGRVACERAQKAAKINNDIVYVWAEACDGAQEALKSTPDLLPVLKRAGVVDAGGKGLCLIFEGMLSVFKDGVILDGEPISETTVQNDDTFRNAAAEFDGDINFTYCTEFIVKRNRFCKLTPLKLRMKLEKIGDCVVVVDDDEIIKVHVHTENPGRALEEGLKYGQFLTVKVENMKEQHRQAGEKQREKLEKETAVEKFEPKKPEEEIGFVAVAAGNGVVNLFKDLGCSNVISGGQTMNPSTEKIIEAILATPAKTVYVFPNNKNIIMSAQQAIALVKDRIVVVVPTKTIAQGVSAILAFNYEASCEENIEIMNAAASKVKTGQITFAARDSEFGGFKIKEGEILALSDGKLVFTDRDAVSAASRLAKSMVTKESEFMTIIYGKDVNSEQAEKLKNEIETSIKQPIDINLISGEQPIYHFIISVE